MEQQLKVPKPSTAVTSECDLYFTCLLIPEAARQGQWAVVASAASAAVEFAAAQNRRTLHFLSAKALSWLALAHEHLGTSASIRAQVRAGLWSVPFFPLPRAF